ncbi:flagellar hook-length control protein FliK [Vibrio fluminensis]|uniref:flagellar hook-length control protein FliK n=1 Tax=Vibrio fluminensis TaxID=2783614 RepID=UPI001887B6A3|nr:flagellar hook-length control protein FliK [Vibrio fluminensis]
MNVNLTSVTESTKLSKGVSEMTTSADEASEAEGFFAKLTAMLKGDSKPAEEQVVTSDASEATSQDESADVMLEAGQEAESETINESSTADSTQALNEQSVTTDDGQEVASEEEIPQQLERFIEKPTDDNSASSTVEATVAESEALLERLEQANQALRAQDGNSLPPQDAQQVSNAKAQPLVAADLTSELSQDDLTQEKLVNQEGVKTPLSDSADLAEVNSDDALLSEKAINEAQLAQNSSSSAVDRAQVELTANNQDSQSLTEKASMDTSQILLAESATPTSAQAELSQTMLQTVNENSEQSVDVIEDATPAIAWASTSTTPVTDGEMVVDDIGKVSLADHSQAKMAHKLTAAELQAQSATSAQQLNSSTHSVLSTGHQAAAMNAAASTLTPTTPMDLSVAQQIPSNIATGAKPEQMALQASLGAKAAATIGKLGQNGEATNGGESSFAQQLSQVAGQTGLNQTARLEQAAQAQPSLQLNREMAGEQVAERIQMMMSKNLKNIDIRLDPPELGRMQIRMNMNGDNASVHFTVANSQARDIVEQAMPRLREMLAQQGMQLSDSSVQQQASGQQQSRYTNGNDTGNGQGSSNQHFDGQENLEADVKLDLNVASKRDGISYYA